MLKHKKFIFLAALIAGSAFTITACEEEDMNKIAQAQECFNQITSTDPDTDADVCLAKINGINSSEANALRCGLLFRSGGLTSLDIVNAYEAQDSVPAAQKESALMDALDLGDVSKATTAYNACEASGVSGLTYLGTMILLSTKVNQMAGADFGAQLDACQADTASCADDSLGIALVGVEQLYCTGETASSQVCQDLANAIATGGSNYTLIAQTFLENIDYN